MATRCSLTASPGLMPRSAAACSLAPNDAGLMPVSVPKMTSALRYEPCWLACR